MFDAGQHSPEALAALQAAYNWVMLRAEHITDADLRHSFLYNVPRNRQVLAAAQQLLGTML